MAASDALLHGKLDRLLAGQERVLAGQEEINTTIGTLRAAMEILSGTLEVQRELLARLGQALSDEQGGDELRELVASIEHTLKLLQVDGENTAEMLAKLPAMVSRAAQEGTRLAMGDAVEVADPGRDGGAR